MILGIMAALPGEMGSLQTALHAPTVLTSGLRTFHCGTWLGHSLVLAVSLWGKVAAATTATTLCVAHGVDAIVFTGLAGALDPALRPGDVVVASHAVQHDLDPRPLFARYEIGSLRQGILPLDAALHGASFAAAQRFLAHGLRQRLSPAPAAALFAAGAQPRAVSGLVATGDQFFASAAAVQALRAALPAALCVEMEGAAVAQVCAEHGIPCALIRTLSDRADSAADVAFSRFIAQAAPVYSRGILAELLPTLPI